MQKDEIKNIFYYFQKAKYKYKHRKEIVKVKSFAEKKIDDSLNDSKIQIQIFSDKYTKSNNITVSSIFCFKFNFSRVINTLRIITKVPRVSK